MSQAVKTLCAECRYEYWDADVMHPIDNVPGTLVCLVNHLRKHVENGFAFVYPTSREVRIYEGERCSIFEAKPSGWRRSLCPRLKPMTPFTVEKYDCLREIMVMESNLGGRKFTGKQ